MNTMLTGKTVLVMGLGRFGGGVDAVRFAAQAGAKVTVTDKATAEQLRDSLGQLSDLTGIEYHLGGHTAEDFTTADVIIANPAVPPDNEFLQLARRHGRTVTSQVGLFFQECPARIIGITGANGKSTTTCLTAYLLEHARPPAPACPYETVWLSGNIGDRPLLTILDRIGPHDVVVLELSSFQLEQLAEVGKAPHVALLTNLTPNHLDRYGTFEAYCVAKEGIFRFQALDPEAPAVSLFNAEDEIARGWYRKYRTRSGRVCREFCAGDVSEAVRTSYALPGRANLSNLAAALAIARGFGVSDDAVQRCLPGFKALPDRLELVGEVDGVHWYNDSKATTPEGTMVALAAFECPKVLIAGGYDKHTPFDELGRRIAAGAKAAVLIGQTARTIADAIRAASQDGRTVDVRLANSLADAVEAARQLAVPGDVVLLSPACASYDMFQNYQQRGRLFAECVSRLGR